MPRIAALAAAVLASLCSASAMAQSVPVNELAGAVVRLKTYINPDGRTVDNLGRQLISVAWDSGVSTYVFVNEIEIKTRVESEVSSF